MPLDVQAVAVFDENQLVFAVDGASEASRGLHDGKIELFQNQRRVLDRVAAEKMGKP